MPAHTEVRIRQLCLEAIAATSKADIDRIIPELREALHEHIGLAKHSLEGQAAALPIIDALMQKRLSEA